MNVSTLQKIDRWMGIPLCLLLTAWRRLAGDAPSNSTPTKRVLFVKLAEQGSTVLAYPALRRAADLVGRENLYFIAFDENRFILDALGVVPEENVITISFSSFPEMVRTAFQAMLRMRRLKFDAAIDFEFFSRGSAAITYLSGARSRAGFHTFHGEGPYRGDLMTHRLLYNPYLHTAQTFRTMVDALSQPGRSLPTFGEPPPVLDDQLPEFRPRPGEHDEVRAIVQQQGGWKEWRPLILLNPNASDLLPLRRWPNNRYLELASRLLARFSEIAIAFTGTSAETLAAEQMVRQIGSPRCFSLAGKTTLRQLVTLYTLADVMVTNDSGPAHFASLTPLDVVTLFGPETPRL